MGLLPYRDTLVAYFRNSLNFLYDMNNRIGPIGKQIRNG